MSQCAHSHSSPITRSALVLLAVVAAALVPGMTARAQAPDTMSASLLRRMAEAADAYRTGQLVWFVADPRPPHSIDTVLVSPPSERFEPPDGFRVYGPFRTPPDSGQQASMVFGCVHLKFPSPSEMHPRRHLWAGFGGLTGFCPMRAVPMDSIALMELVVVTLSDTLRIELPPNRVDAVFMSTSAFDKFVAPYYASVHGPAYAKVLRDSLEAFVRR